MHEIPKIIHYCWLSDEEFPPIVKKCMDSWQAHLSDFQFIKWDKSRFDVENHSWTKQAMKHGKFAFVSDYIRLHALFHYGGIYLDTDVEVLREFDESLLRNDIFMGFEHSGIPEAAIIGSKPHQDWIKSALNWYDINSFIRKNGSLNLTISPVILQNAFYNQFGLRLKERDTVQKFEGISVFPYQYFSPRIK